MPQKATADSVSTSDKAIPTVSRVHEDTIVELVYDRDRRKTGLVVSRFGGLWNIEQEVSIAAETLVPYSPRNNLIVNECVMLPSIPLEFGYKDELLHDIEAFLHRYVDVTPLFERVAAHYVLLTWVYDAFNEVPYLRLRGDYGVGKTRALMAIGSLCYKGFFASGASTVSPIFHTLDAFGGTLLLDEADLRFSDATADLVKILNNGNVRGLPVLRTVQNRHKEFNPRAFKVFGPKIIAMRESFNDKALESRFLTEEMGGRSLREDIPIQVPPALRDEALILRNRLLHFQLCNLFGIKTDPTRMPAHMEPRLKQTAMSLLSLVDDRALQSDIQLALLRQNANILSDRSQSVEAGVLASVQEAFAHGATSPVSIRDVTDRFNALVSFDYGRTFSNKFVGNILRQRFHLETRKYGGIYVIAQSEKPKIDSLCVRFGVASNEIHTTDKTAA